jgi:hypothetical protein
LFRATWSIFQLSGGCHHYSAANLDLCLALKAFSSENSFTCHTCCDMEPPFMQSNLQYQTNKIRYTLTLQIFCFVWFDMEISCSYLGFYFPGQALIIVDSVHHIRSHYCVVLMCYHFKKKLHKIDVWLWCHIWYCGLR